MQNQKTIIVTGSNKGMGYALVETLAARGGWSIIMAVRNVQLGEASKAAILKNHPQAQIHLEKLDISNSNSIDEFMALLTDKYKSVDILVNNAGIAWGQNVVDEDNLKATFSTVKYCQTQNFWGTMELSQKILPVLKLKGKIVSYGSRAGHMAFAKFTNDKLKEQLNNPNISKEHLVALIKEFEEGVLDSSCVEKGWPRWIYGVSKLGINLYHRWLGRHEEVLKKHIQVYVCCPGWIKTDLTRQNDKAAPVEEGIKTPLYLIDLPSQVNNELQGGMFYDLKLQTHC